ncbi:MAG: hypothetical protein KCHDKBKB_03006 [Elusimicrobia bacterium]|nr:hypothetical protein [Elusimicrobiota bacterium]
MPSVFDLRHAELRMTDAEHADLLARGFREAGDIRHDDGTSSPSFLRQTHFPHLHIQLHPGDTLDDLLSAIYDRAYCDGSDRIATFFNRLVEECRRPRPPTPSERSLDQRLRALEEKLSTQH